MNEAIERLKVKFAGDASDGLSRIDAWLSALGESGDRAIVDRIREEAHGLKGAAAVLEFTEFRDRTGALEEFAAGMSTSREWPADAMGHLEALVLDARDAAPQANAV